MFKSNDSTHPKSEIQEYQAIDIGYIEDEILENEKNNLPDLILLYEKNISTEILEQKTIEPTKRILIFAGVKQDFEDVKSNLYDIKKSNALAKNWGKKKNPTFAIVNINAGSFFKENICENKMAELYKFLGAGFTLMLPVEPYSSAAQKISDNFIPRLWGEPSKNSDRHEYYIKELNKLAKFIELFNDQDPALASFKKENKKFYQAFEKGSAAKLAKQSWCTAKNIAARRQINAQDKGSDKFIKSAQGFNIILGVVAAIGILVIVLFFLWPLISIPLSIGIFTSTSAVLGAQIANNI